MPSPHGRSRSGQAAADYVALLCLVAVVLTAAGAAAGRLPAVGGLPAAVLRQVQVALCLVGGDVCRDADARAMGLAPCVVRSDRFERRWSASGFVLSAFQAHGSSIERRSDGRITVAVSHDRQGGAGSRTGARLGPVGASAGGEVTAGWRSGMAWELDGPAALRRFLARAPSPHRLEHDADWRRRDLPPPDVRYLAGGGSVRLDAIVEAGVVVPLVTAGAEAALGRRTDRRGTAWFFDVPGAAATALGGSLPEVELGRAGPWSAEVAADRDGRARTLTLRSRATTPRRDEEVELTRTIDLGSAEAAAAARDLLDPERALPAARRLTSLGSLQRDVYRVRELDSAPDVELSALVAGIGHTDARTQRRLVRSTVTPAAGATVRRADCLGASP